MRSILSLALSPIALCLVALSATPGSDTPPTPETVIAVVDGRKITFGEFEQKRADNLFQARDTFYHEERKVLDSYIEDYLLREEAQKEGITVDQLLERRVKSMLPKDPSEEALRVYYEGVNSPEPFEALRDKILEHIRQIRFDKAKAAYIQTLRSKANVVISLPPPRANITLDNNTPVLGAQNAPVIFVEFADYECPYCQQVAPAIAKLETEYQGRVAFAFKDTPLPMHPHAEKAAEAARCAGAQGKFWDFHDQLFASKKLEISDLKEDAKKLNLNVAAFDQCLDSGLQAGAVKAQVNEANDLGITGTPSFFINGRYMSGAASYELLRDAIEQELATAGPKQPKETASR